MCFWGHNAKNLYMGYYVPKQPLLRVGVGLLAIMSSQITSERLNRFQSCLAQTKQLRERTSVLRAKLLNLLLEELVIEKLPQREFPIQAEPFYNYSTTQPILTSSNAMYARGKWNMTESLYQNFNLRRNLHQNFPMEFPRQKSKCVSNLQMDADRRRKVNGPQ
jgi:hypothetical protein